MREDLMNLMIDQNQIDKDRYLREMNENNKLGEQRLLLPFPPNLDEAKKDKFVFRLVFKPETGTLWGYNEF